MADLEQQVKFLGRMLYLSLGGIAILLVVVITIVVLYKPKDPLSTENSYANSESCGKSARDWFLAKYGDSKIMDYSSHFNIKQHRCFIKTDQFSPTSDQYSSTLGMMDVWDVNENVEYAHYWMGQLGQDQVRTMCNVLQDNCKDAGEWEKLVIPLMTE